ncbi:hypothetical protein M409DRAFT_17258 [Zasmidium cellare ATCC 36951]|uniref:Azaphilone pigments biosynthesis cluster protein L N-terminal domain-containing protein n=1 Tax=Zasmidium cellare ATCC 36951 TaxID=1080233 RepID=A0A6A6D1L4_ZASCE|nr:uncharacterized protein M409DRAFT_17258 [Zasmidium cellare ATCC 36951]KAF2173317.1 hypothetical protein M409DRAFT_17258 [Zasmidium cellare ATCC 36951]
MADPLSITASLLAISTAAVQTTKALCETVKRYRGRDKTLRRLQDELDDLTRILEALTRVTAADESLSALLQGPVGRCTQICHDFELSMERFAGKSKTGFKDWTKLEFMRGDINEFIETISGLKSTIAVGVGTVTMNTAKISQQVLLEYNEMIQDTVYNLELHLQRVDDKMTNLTTGHRSEERIPVDLKDEKEVTRQCLRVCEEAKIYIQKLSTGASSLLDGESRGAAREPLHEAQIKTRQTLYETQENFAQTFGHLSRRLEALIQNQSPDDDDERSKLEKDIQTSKQCLDVCNIATEITRQKVYKIGEVIADGNSDQVVVTTLADLFDIGKATSKDSSAQLLGSMSEEALRHLADQRYSSRFGAVVTNSLSEVHTTRSQPASEKSNKVESQSKAGDQERLPRKDPRSKKPSSNEIRKRTPGEDTVASD